MRKILLFSLLALSTTLPVHAQSVACPDAASIKMVYFDGIVDEGSSLIWSGYIKKNRFGTNSPWSFSFAYAPADDKASARKLLTTELQKISYDYKYESDGVTVCNYATHDDYGLNGIAFNPPLPYFGK